jgi:hypothetical protein
MQLGLVGLGAGAAAALLFASATAGSWLSIILFYLAALPIMIAGLGWSHWAAMVAAISGAGAVGALFGSMPLFTFLVGVGIPAWWLSYLTLLARPVATAPGNLPAAANDALEWYPVGRLVAWAAVMAPIFVVVVLILAFGIDADGYRAAMTKTIAEALSRFFAENPELSKASSERLVAFLVAITPPTAAVGTTIISVVNLWLAARVVSFSGRLKRPWPDLSAITFPKMLISALAIALVLNVAGGMLGIIALVFSSTLMLAFALVGLAVLHTVTRGLTGRPFMLGSVYISAPLLSGWPILAFALIGVGETAFDLRARLARKRGAPPRT